MKQFDMGAARAVIIGVTGHRNIPKEDFPALREQVKDGLRALSAMTVEAGGENVPLVMLSGFAQGADLICVEAATALGIAVCAVLPCGMEKFKKSFGDPSELEKFETYIKKARQIFIAPDIEGRRAWMLGRGVDGESYEYRQVGVFLATHSHFLVALWDGKPPKTPFGCGTAEVVGFALGEPYFHGEDLLSRDIPVLWVKARRQGDPPIAPLSKWLTRADFPRKTQ